MGNRTKTKSIALIASFILAAAFAAVIFICLVPKIPKQVIVKGFGDYKTVTANPGARISYPFTYNRTYFDSIVFFVMEGNAQDLSVTVSDEGKEYLKNVLITEEMCSAEGKSVRVTLNRPEGSRFKAGNYTVSLFNNSSSSPVKIVLGTDDTLVVRLLADNTTGLYILAIVCVLLVIFLISVVYIGLNDGLTPFIPVEKLFLAAAIPICAAFILLIPPWSTNDSESHYLACYRLSNLFLGQFGGRQWLGRADDVSFFKDIWWGSTLPSTGSYEVIKNNLQLFANNKNLVEMTARSEKMNYYSAFCYLPQTAALVIGRLIGFGPMVNCYLAKILTSVFYITLCYRAIKKAPFAKEIIAFCAILPSSLSMGSAFSYDPMVMISSMNFIASVLYLKNDPEERKAYTSVCIWSFMLGEVKGGGYLLLLPLILIVLSKENGLKPTKLAMPFLSGILSVCIFDLFLPDRTLFQFGSKGNGYMTASFAVENPGAYLIMAVKAYGRFMKDLLSDLFGSKICWGENTLPFFFTIVMIVLLIIIAASDDGLPQLRSFDVAIIFAVILISLLTTPAMLLSWTPEGSDVILGIQGHYFLPILPLIAILLGKGLRGIVYKTGFWKRRAADYIKLAPYPAIVVMIFFAFYYIMKLYLTK
ncbi:MAG: DUF2142 domain-containing protein [Clostridiales bacterium]|nr:DUF2142 domain-containing protein [Clostridiales bacterium]